MKVKKFLIGITILASTSMAVGCGSKQEAKKDIDLNSMRFEEIVNKAKEEKRLRL